MTNSTFLLYTLSGVQFNKQNIFSAQCLSFFLALLKPNTNSGCQSQISRPEFENLYDLQYISGFYAMEMKKLPSFLYKSNRLVSLPIISSYYKKSDRKSTVDSSKMEQ